MSQSIFTLSNNRRLKLSSTVIDLMFSYAQDSPDDLESGGILIGRILESNSDYVVDDASTPMPMDIQKRSSFIRESVGHQEFFDHHWSNHDGRCFYLGEWHSHPEGVPRPSPVDLRGWRNLLHAKIQNQNMLFFIIVGTKKLVIWKGTNMYRKVRINKVGEVKRNEES